MDADPNATVDIDDECDGQGISAWRLLELIVIAIASSAVILQLIWMLGDNGV